MDPVLGRREEEGVPKSLSTGVNKLKERKKGSEPIINPIDGLEANEDMAEQSLQPNNKEASLHLSRGLDEAPFRYSPAVGYFNLSQTLS